MISLHSRIPGHSLERLAALSDGIFSVAMTLLVLDLRVPLAATIHSNYDLAHALAAVWPQFLMYALSFLGLGLAWAAQQTEMSWMARSHRDLAWIQILFLFGVTMMPFSTRLLSEFHGYRLAFLFYWGHISSLGLLLYFGWLCAIRLKLLKEDMPAEVPLEIRRRFFTSEGLYTFGAALCLISTYLSIAFMLLVQLHYAVAPSLRRGSKP